MSENMNFIENFFAVIDWSDDDVWEFIKSHNLPVNPLYFRGYKRVGCIGCPMSPKRRNEEFSENPKYKNLYFRAVVRHLEYRKQRGLKTDGVMESPESYFEWWLRC